MCACYRPVHAAHAAIIQASAVHVSRSSCCCSLVLFVCGVSHCHPAGTGGSLLVIGSAAGVAYMGLEGVGFGWYFRRVTPWALLGYAAANLCYIGLHGLPQGMLGGG